MTAFVGAALYGTGRAGFSYAGVGALDLHGNTAAAGRLFDPKMPSGQWLGHISHRRMFAGAGSPVIAVAISKKCLDQGARNGHFGVAVAFEAGSEHEMAERYRRAMDVLNSALKSLSEKGLDENRFTLGAEDLQSYAQRVGQNLNVDTSENFSLLGSADLILSNRYAVYEEAYLALQNGEKLLSLGLRHEFRNSLLFNFSEPDEDQILPEVTLETIATVDTEGARSAGRQLACLEDRMSGLEHERDVLQAKLDKASAENRRLQATLNAQAAYENTTPADTAPVRQRAKFNWLRQSSLLSPELSFFQRRLLKYGIVALATILIMLPLFLKKRTAPVSQPPAVSKPQAATPTPAQVPSQAAPQEEAQQGLVETCRRSLSYHYNIDTKFETPLDQLGKEEKNNVVLTDEPKGIVGNEIFLLIDLSRSAPDNGKFYVVPSLFISFAGGTRCSKIFSKPANVSNLAQSQLLRPTKLDQGVYWDSSVYGFYIILAHGLIPKNTFVKPNVIGSQKLSQLPLANETAIQISVNVGGERAYRNGHWFELPSGEHALVFLDAS